MEDAIFIERHISAVLQRMSRLFPTVLVTGARQTGKTTLLKNSFGGIPYFTLDDRRLLNRINDDIYGFIEGNRPPMIIDEIQYQPELMRAIKISVDSSGKKGEYFLTGSQQYHLMKDVTESLAGRIGILNLSGLSTREINRERFNEPFIPTEEYCSKRKASVTKLDMKDLWARIHRGSMPALYANDFEDLDEFYTSYVNSYIERDVRALTQVGDEQTFMQFLIACAGMTGRQLNISNLANDVKISESTAKRWLSILETSDIIHLLRPFSMNMTSRVVKTPKLYFMDTGLATHLCGWPTPETLERGPMGGPMFETYVVTEIIKSYRNAGKKPPIYFYRDADKREIDLLIHKAGALYPIEIKKSSTPDKRDVKQFETLKRYTGIEIAPGALISTYDMPGTLNGRDFSIPVNYI